MGTILSKCANPPPAMVKRRPDLPRHMECGIDPLDARVLVWMSGFSGPEIINLGDRASKELNASQDEIQISFFNLAKVGCISHDAQRSQHPILVAFGRKLLSACYD